jgi:hypothetical protein
MTAPEPPDPVVFTPAWLAPADVKNWLRGHGADVTDDPLIQRAAAAVESQVQAARPDRWSPVNLTIEPPEPATYVPDAEVYQAAVMLAARVVRRRNSPGGLETFAESVIYVSQYDPEIQRALRQGPWRHLLVG